MPTPATRTPVRVARGTYSNLNGSKTDIQEGEVCYATDQKVKPKMLKKFMII